MAYRNNMRRTEEKHTEFTGERVFQNRNFPNTWQNHDAFEEEDNRPLKQSGRGSFRGTSRSSQWRGKPARGGASSRGGKSKPQKEQTEPEKPKPRPATVETPEAATTKYNVGPMTGLTPITAEYSQNIDFSTFPTLVDACYDELLAVDGTLAKKLPYCAFLHHCVVAGTATLIDVAQNENNQREFNFNGNVRPILDEHILPLPIIDYLDTITQTRTCEEDVVRINIPQTAIPLDTDDETAGTLGNIDAMNHNKYECYLSPRTTRRRIEAVSNRNQNWTPLPEDMMPPGLTPTANFIGYGALRHNAPASLSVLDNLHFPPDDGTLNSRLQYCPELTARVNSRLETVKERFKIASASTITRKIIPANVGYVQVNDVSPSTEPIAIRSGILFSSNPGSGTLSNLMYLWGLHRRRTETAPACCFLNGANIPNGWMLTINSNFTMTAPFAPVRGVDSAKLRLPTFSDLPAVGYRYIDITNFVRSYKILRK